jgi:hypothetical protein
MIASLFVSILIIEDENEIKEDIFIKKKKKYKINGLISIQAN